ncbi:MAG: DUF3857 domain-containing protein, partial [Bacteroidota bacterium]
FSQDYRFGKVSKEELSEAFNPSDSSANASFLYKFRRTSFQYVKDKGFFLKTEIHERIKIYNQEGFDFATKKIRLHRDGSTREKLMGLKAYTFNLQDGKVEDTKLRNDGIFDNETSDYITETTFTMPNIGNGCVVEYKYEISSPFIMNVDEFVIQHEIPVKKLVAKFESPEYFNYKSNTKGFLSISPTKSNKTGSINFANRTSSGIYQRNSSVEYSQTDYVIQVFEYDLNNIPALVDEPYVNNINNYRSAVKYELSYTKFPNSNLDYYSTTWEDVVKTIYDSENFGGQLAKQSYFKNDVDALIQEISDPGQKIFAVYDFVKRNVRWNGYYGKYTDVGVRKAYKDNVGNVAEINLMLTSMLRYCGFNANPVLVSTRANGVPLFPTREGYNYVISAIEIENQVILLDATSVFSSPNILPFRALNWEGRVIREQGSSSLVNLYPSTKAKTTKFINIDIQSDGTVEGKIRDVRTNHEALVARASLFSDERDAYLENLENLYGGIDISEFETKNENILSKPLVSSYNFSADSQYEIIADKIYLTPMLFFCQDENPFKLDKRAFPVDFGYPHESKVQININIPEGYEIVSVPESTAFSLERNFASFKYMISHDDKNVQILIDNEINSPIVSSSYYDTLKKYYDQLVKKETEKIVLAKIEP